MARPFGSLKLILAPSALCSRWGERDPLTVMMVLSKQMHCCFPVTLAIARHGRYSANLRSLIRFCSSVTEAGFSGSGPEIRWTNQMLVSLTVPSAMSGQVDCDHGPMSAQRIKRSAPGMPTSAETVNQQQFAARAALNVVHPCIPRVGLCSSHKSRVGASG